jgi:hypothetical protein
VGKKGSYHAYNTIPKSREWLSLHCAINVIWSSLLGFYIFRGENIRNNYIKNCRTRTCIVMQRKIRWFFLIQKIPIFFQKVSSRWHHKIKSTSIILRWTWITCWIRNNIITSIGIWIGHGYLTISHFSCLATIGCELFQTFQKTFNKEKDNAMVKNNHYELEKCTFIIWVNKALDNLCLRKTLKVVWGYRDLAT